MSIYTLIDGTSEIRVIDSKDIQNNQQTSFGSDR